MIKKNNKDLVSIIIPVYNVENYIDRCVESLLNQTYKNIEIILVDDGSIDISGKMCDEYKKKDNRVVVFHKKNGGVSSARNFGLDNANGEFITFIDSDDYVENTYIESFVNIQKKGDYDIVISNAVDFKNDIPTCIESEKFIELNKKQSLKSFLNNDFFTCVCWGRLYKSRILIDLYFDENMRVAEDGKFFLNAIENSKKNAVVEFRKYFYYLRDGSAIRTKFNDNFFDEIYFCDEIIHRYSQDKELEFLSKMKKIKFLETLFLSYKLNKYYRKKLLIIYNDSLKNIKLKNMHFIKKVIINNIFLLNSYLLFTNKKRK